MGSMHRLRQALASEAATAVTFLSIWLLSLNRHTGPAPAILGAVIAMALSRRTVLGERLHIAIEAVGVVVIGLLAAGVGLLLEWNLLAGGTIFALAVGSSIYLRGLHDDARVIGTVVALPFIAILVVPIAPGALREDPWSFLCAPIIALVVSELVKRTGLVHDRRDTPMPERRPSSLKLPPHVRMALQMFVALELAFIIGAAFAPQHWPWIVLTAYIVCAGALGRADSVHKGILRLAGALAGGVIAALLAIVVPANGIADTLLIFAVLFVGFLLREINYAYWAACTTAIFAMLQRIDAAFTVNLYLTRLECIVVGAACGIAAASFVLPLKTADILRRRLADALGKLEKPDEHSAEELRRSFEAVNRLAHSLELHRHLTRSHASSDHPAQWVRITREIFSQAERTRVHSDVFVRAIRKARASIRDQRGVTEALLAVLDASGTVEHTL